MNDIEFFLDEDNEIARRHEEWREYGDVDASGEDCEVVARMCRRAERDRAELWERGRRLARECQRLRLAVEEDGKEIIRLHLALGNLDGTRRTDGIDLEQWEARE